MLQFYLHPSIATDKNEAFLTSTTAFERNNVDFNKREGTWLQIIFTTPTALRTEVKPYCSKWKKLGNCKMCKVKPDFCSWLCNRTLLMAPKLWCQNLDPCGKLSTLALITWCDQREVYDVNKSDEKLIVLTKCTQAAETKVSEAWYFCLWVSWEEDQTFEQSKVSSCSLIML